MFKVYGKTHCKYCVAAIEDLDMFELDYEYVSLDDDLTMVYYVQRKAHMNTVPIIFEGDRLVGGYTELSNLLEKRFL